ncbi:hypothetical protein [Saccharothrix syringae]|uniref:Uncharacterized protein n=1 Tax=Saccharothrix syringae TaxID=103733 RepID=A0A5Q0H453_SACSY|nr:hypothetical protein [Saccharothrix syringae]QFZ20580.1 hypothetical protein EKG83_27060 [Saccharothrix syringae]
MSRADTDTHANTGPTAAKAAIVTDELLARTDLLARALRVAGRFTDTLSWWVGYGLRRTQRIPDQVHALNPDEALLLDLPVGQEVVRRDGFMIPALGHDNEPLAAVTSLVHLRRLGLSAAQRAILHHGATPVGVLAGDAVRACHFVTVLDTEPEPEQPALRVRATLVSGGRPAVLTEETVYWRALLARPPRSGPQTVPVFAARTGW